VATVLMLVAGGLGLFLLARRSHALREELDETRRSLAESVGRLARSQTYLQQAERLARVATYEIGIYDGVHDDWSEGVYRVLGRDPAEGVVQDRAALAHVVHPDDRERMQNILVERRGERSFEAGFRLIRGDGSVRDVRVAAELIRDARGRAMSVLGTLLDVTDRHQAERMREFAAAVARSSADSIISTDLDGVITTWNRGAEAILGYAAEDIVGKHGDALWVDRELARRLLGRARRGEDVLSQEIAAQRKDGAIVQLSITVSPLRDADGRIVGVSSVAQEIGERKRIEATLRQRQKLEALGTLAGGIAHDFNNLLWVILGNAQLAQRALGSSPTASEQLERIVGASRRASELVDRILSFARPSSVAARPMHVGSVVEDAVALFRTTVPPDVRIVTDLRAADAWIEAEPGQLSQVLLNLATNALGAIGGSGSVTFRSSNWDEGIETEVGVRRPAVLIEVTDTGGGIAPENLDRIFDPFFTTREVGRGSGLGLAIVQGIVASLGGEIELLTVVDQGSSFRIRLPTVVPPAIPAEVAASASPLSPAGRGEDILVVDDDVQVLALLESLLADAGYSVHAFTDPVAALAAFETGMDGFRLIVADQVMPRLTGSELVARIRALRPDLPALLLSGYHDPLGEAPPAAGVLRKPIESSELIDRVHALLSSARAVPASRAVSS
jgi:PAS domain S-box-containing protein